MAVAVDQTTCDLRKKSCFRPTGLDCEGITCTLGQASMYCKPNLDLHPPATSCGVGEHPAMPSKRTTG